MNQCTSLCVFHTYYYSQNRLIHTYEKINICADSDVNILQSLFALKCSYFMFFFIL